MRFLLPLFLLCLPALAKPPGAAGYARADKLAARIKEHRAQMLMVRPERMMRLLLTDTVRFEGRRLTVEWVTREVLSWPPLLRADPTQAERRVLSMLGDVLNTRLGAYQSSVTKKMRAAPGRVLVKALSNPFRHIRQAAVDGLKAMYGTTRGYQPDASRVERNKKQNEWRRALR